MNEPNQSSTSPHAAMLNAARAANIVLREWFEKAKKSEDPNDVLGSVIKNNDLKEHYNYEDVFTKADLDSEKAILPILKGCLDIPIVSEESHPECADWPDGVRRWLVDPLDGTSQFKKGLPQFSVTIALQTKKNGAWKTDIGLVSAPMEDKIYIADQTAQLVHGTEERGLQNHAQEIAAFSGTRNDALKEKRVEIVCYSKKNQTIISMDRDLMENVPYRAQKTFSSALVMARMAEPEGVDGVVLAGNALDYDWDIHAAVHIAQTAGIKVKHTQIDDEPLVILGKNSAILNALETRFRETYQQTKQATALACH